MPPSVPGGPLQPTAFTPTWNTAELRFYGTPECIADWDMDDDADQGDYGLYESHYLTGDPLADLNGDRIVDGDDWEEFIDQYAAGCE